MAAKTQNRGNEKNMETSEVLHGYNGSLMNQTIQCELCTGKNFHAEIDKADNYVYLCSHCSNYLETLPETIKGDINNFLIGNII